MLPRSRNSKRRFMSSHTQTRSASTSYDSPLWKRRDNSSRRSKKRLCDANPSARSRRQSLQNIARLEDDRRHELAIGSDQVDDDFAGVHPGQAIAIRLKTAAAEACRSSTNWSRPAASSADLPPGPESDLPARSFQPINTALR